MSEVLRAMWQLIRYVDDGDFNVNCNYQCRTFFIGCFSYRCLIDVVKQLYKDLSVDISNTRYGK